jgi:glycine/D-amino acid oxidase-like deaminating enzyme
MHEPIYTKDRWQKIRKTDIIFPIMTEHNADVTIIGGGIAGLWSAKELVDQGFSVSLVEASEQLATGATTRNEGWLHAGAYHSMGIKDYEDANNVVERTLYGHRAITDFAPDSVEHGTSYAFIKNPTLIDETVSRWQEFGVRHRVAKARSFEDDGFNVGRISAAFEVEDKSVNSRVICRKLAAYILERGVRIYTGAEFVPLDEGSADIITGDEINRLHSERFLITAGVSIKDVVERVTGQPFPMRYFKSHLLVTPRLTRDNGFYVDWNEAGVMGHGNATIVGYNRDSVEIAAPDYEVMPHKKQLVYDALVKLLPKAADHTIESTKIMGIACVKPDVFDTSRVADPDSRQNLNINVFDIGRGYTCAIPGKMTEAPALGRSVVKHLLNDGLIRHPSPEAQVVSIDERHIHKISLRPADRWMADQELPNAV